MFILSWTWVPTDVSNSILIDQIILAPCPSLSINPHSNSEKLSSHCPFNCLDPGHPYSNKEIVNLYLHEKYLYQLEYRGYVQLILSLVLWTLLISRVT